MQYFLTSFLEALSNLLALRIQNTYKINFLLLLFFFCLCRLDGIILSIKCIDCCYVQAGHRELTEKSVLEVQEEN